ncbi:hypothetical protein [Buttiauxella noackiae]|nr:hypothetical protein [Buttiauxella noackiae]MCA1922162.1 hypothetical protein [Buttiauxella noackiae]
MMPERGVGFIVGRISAAPSAASQWWMALRLSTLQVLTAQMANMTK